MTEIGMRLKEERVRLSLTQKTFAAVGGVQANAQSKYEKGERSPNAIYLAQLAELGVDVLYVVTGRQTRMEGENDLINALIKLPRRERRVITELVGCIARRA